MNQPEDEASALAAVRFCVAFVNTVIVLGGAALVALAVSAAQAGLAAPAAFIGACGLALLATVGWAAWSRQKARSLPPSP